MGSPSTKTWHPPWVPDEARVEASHCKHPHPLPGIRLYTTLNHWVIHRRPLSCLTPPGSLCLLSDKRGSRSCAVSLLMTTTEELFLHSPPRGCAPLYGNPWVNCSSNHAWVCQSFCHCTGHSSLPSEYAPTGVGPIGPGHHCSICTGHVAWHRPGMQQTFVEWTNGKFLCLPS